MKYIKGKGLVLSSIDYKESDKLITLYIFGYGKILVRARGVRKSNSKLKNACILMSFGEFVIGDTKSHILISYDGIDMFMSNGEKLGRYYAKCALIEFLNKITYEGIEQDDVATKILRSIKEITYSKDTEEKYLVYALIQSLKLLGYESNYLKSSITGKSLMSGARFSVFDGGLVQCSNVQSDNLQLSTRAIKQLQYFVNADFDNLEKISSCKVEINSIMFWLYQYIPYRWETKFNALNMYVEYLNII